MDEKLASEIQEEWRPEFYDRSYSTQEIADLVNLALDDTLADELAAVRVTIRRVMSRLNEELEPAEFGRLAGMVFTGANTVARLLRTRQEINGGMSQEGIMIIVQAGAELDRELGRQL